MNMLGSVSLSKKTKKIALGVGAAVVAIAVPALASTPIFHNQGYISGMNGTNLDADCQVMQSDPNNAATHYSVGDPNSVYVSTNFTGGYTHRYHAMVRETNAYTQEGDEGYYSWAFRLKSTW